MGVIGPELVGRHSAKRTVCPIRFLTIILFSKIILLLGHTNELLDIVLVDNFTL